MNINSWIGAGRLTKDATCVFSLSGYKCRMRLRVGDNLYMSAVLFCNSKKGKYYRESLKKGRMVGIQGKIAQHDNEIVVMVDDLTIAPRKTCDV
jgi:hypothetical protein